MTLQALPSQPEVWRPTGGYHLAALQEDSQARSVSVAEKSADQYWEEWWAKCDKLMAMQVPVPPPAQRLVRYQQKPVFEAPPVPPMVMPDAKGQPQVMEQPQPPLTGSWSGQKIDFPSDFQHDLMDWMKLEPVSLRRDQVLRELAVFEMQIAGQQGMAQPPALAGLPPPTSGVAGDLPELPWTAQQQAPPA